VPSWSKLLQSSLWSQFAKSLFYNNLVKTHKSFKLGGLISYPL
jgi:hypothetical protein